jgi:hypothetical protein
MSCKTLLPIVALLSACACNGFTPVDLPLDAGPLAPDVCDVDEAARGECDPYDQDHFAFSAAEQLCGLLFECCVGDELLNRQELVRQLVGQDGLSLLLLQEPDLLVDAQACRRGANQVFLQRFEQPLLAQLAGRRAALDPTLARACFEPLERARSLCAPAAFLATDTEPEACSTMFAPLQPTDAPCTSDDDCVQDEPRMCISATGPNANGDVTLDLDGTCQAVPSEGEPCAYEDGRCGDGLLCRLSIPADNADPSPVRTCQAPRNDLGPCAVAQLGERCPDNDTSSNHLQGLCLPNAQGTFTCEALCVFDVCGDDTACTVVDVGARFVAACAAVPAPAFCAALPRDPPPPAPICVQSNLPDRGRDDAALCSDHDDCASEQCDAVLQVCVNVAAEEVAFAFCLNPDDPRPRYRDTID